ncbi:hypothetical protein C452_08609 [Haloferax volcanii JCM 10717]|uniref:Uncharacterized protein n=3 Tax=Haloferax volcanii TaxID=2246 RepID=L9UMH6_HALVD|nr:hypothetical protein C498_16399 [Haloferax volcanii DS2]ELZ70684.1 hypothetical protein C456_15977 [Haloferax lucentense DSM 14919]ELZ90891.1 hypothetical protein C452_08609 [Haloferax alexandrinus JCM 10717]
MSVHHRANYATVFIGSHLHPEGETLDLDWADDAGDETETFEFDVPTDDPREPYLGIQAFDVGEYGHEIRINGDPLSGFDIPPGDGWQYWVDTVTGASLVEGTNTIRVVRDDEGNDAFAVGTVTVHWKEPVEE